LSKKNKLQLLNTLTFVSIITLSNLSLSASDSINETSDEVESFDKISVTATKEARKTKDVPFSISVLDEKDVENKNILNISSAIGDLPGVNAETENGGYDARLIIRGAGLKANYGVREIMVIRDGVPMTDPDSFTRFDFIDMQDVERIEVQKGPGSILASNTVGGVIQIISKSVFDMDSNRIKISGGNFGDYLLNARATADINNTHFFAITGTVREAKNTWRDHNEFSSKQFGLKYGYLIDDSSQFESEVSYTQADFQLPPSLTEDEFKEFQKTGEIKETSSTWQDSARNSKILFVNLKYQKEMGDFTFKPILYMNKWSHFHPVTGAINDSPNNSVYGTDLEMNYAHTLFDNDASLIFGVTGKLDKSNNSEKYQYADVEMATSYTGASKISSTLSDEKGDLMSVGDSQSSLVGLYAQETLSPAENVTIDLGFRVDRLSYDMSGNEYSQYNYSTGIYEDGDGAYSLKESFVLVSPKLGITRKINENLNLYASVASAQQAPTDSEISANRAIDKETPESAKSLNYEVGLKQRSKNFSFDLAMFKNDVTNEIVSTTMGSYPNTYTVFNNAGSTEKIGVELASQYRINDEITLGANYTYSNFKYKDYVDGGDDFSGKFLPYIPKHSYSLSAGYQAGTGLKALISTKTWGEYYVDDENSDTYKGYDLITNLMLGYDYKQHSVQFNVDNLFNEYYAIQVTKSYSTSYDVGAPRTWKLTYMYNF
jgi:iron complex outermembrane receptor protein